MGESGVWTHPYRGLIYPRSESLWGKRKIVIDFVQIQHEMSLGSSHLERASIPQIDDPPWTSGLEDQTRMEIAHVPREAVVLLWICLCPCLCPIWALNPYPSPFPGDRWAHSFFWALRFWQSRMFEGLGCWAPVSKYSVDLDCHYRLEESLVRSRHPSLWIRYSQSHCLWHMEHQ